MVYKWYDPRDIHLTVHASAHHSKGQTCRGRVLDKIGNEKGLDHETLLADFDRFMKND